MNLDTRRYILEAKHSFAILLGFIGEPDTPCNMMLLKWPDAVDALLDDDEDKFREDMATLMCQPIKIISESLFDILNSNGGCDIDFSVQIKDTIQLSPNNPVEAKNNLISICNQIIFKLRSVGVEHEYVKCFGEKA